MAIKDTTRKPYIEDNDENIFIGIDLPFRKSNGIEGYFASTSTTIESVKNNIRNLVNTHQGERFMQPQLGMNLRKFFSAGFFHHTWGRPPMVVRKLFGLLPEIGYSYHNHIHKLAFYSSLRY